MRTFTKYAVVVGLVSGVGLLAPCGLQAQQRSTGSTSSGMFGSRSVGGASGLSGGQRSFTGSGGGGNQQTLGQSQQVGGGQAVLGRTLQQSNSGQLTGRFVRDSRGAGQFVGSDASDVGAALGTLGGGQGIQGLQGRQGQQNLRGNNAQNRNRQPNQQQGQQGQSRSSRQTPFRVSRSPSVSFGNPPSATGAAPTLNARLAGMIQNSTRIQTRSPVEVEMQGRIAVLRGTVATDYDRDLAARLVLLEPGVYQVENQLTVDSGEPAPLPLEE